jgi:DNA polymerase III subunit delta'
MTEIDEPDRLPGAPHPRETASLHGHAAAEAAFLAAAEGGRAPHAWLLTGPRGVGKATLAWRIARWLVAGGTGATLAMAPEAPAFRALAGLASPQLFLCRRPWDDKGERLRTQITVDEVRALKGFFQRTAADGGHRVAIVDAADEMNGAAANALLKILEEPPVAATLILVSHQPGGLLPTIRSRCRPLRLAPLGPEDLARALADAGHPPEAASAAALAALAGGSAGAAQALVAGDGLARYDEIAALLATAPLDRRRAIALAEAATGRDGAERYALTLDLVRLALSRLALAGAGAPLAPASDAEARLFARLGATPAQGRLWADLVPALVARTVHARAVNLDPAQVILDTFLHIDAAAAEARAYAA